MLGYRRDTALEGAL